MQGDTVKQSDNESARWPTRLALFWRTGLTTGDRIALGTAIIHITIFLVAAVTLVVTWLYAAKQLSASVTATEYQNAIQIIDQSLEIEERLNKQSTLLDVLTNKTTEREPEEAVEEILERYQRLLFKVSILEENGLMPSPFWKAFLADFCRKFYDKYPYIQGWWARQKVREPYATLSRRYKSLSSECPGQGWK
jgi:hypothetical protein